MSQLSDIRTDLGRWLQDSVGVQWGTTVLNRYINLALRETQKHILSVDPEAFKCTLTASSKPPSDDGADNIYSYPRGTFAVHEIALSSDAENYIVLERRTLSDIRQARAGTMSTFNGFVPYDSRHFILWPSASNEVAEALRIIVAPTLVLTENTEENPLPTAYETLMMLYAHKLCLFDVGESTDDVQKEIDKVEEKSPRFYLTATEPAFIAPVVPDRYGT